MPYGHARRKRVKLPEKENFQKELSDLGTKYIFVFKYTKYMLQMYLNTEY